jgi:hypothetical protein
VECLPDNHIKFDFLGKDSIRYENEVAVHATVWRLVQQFCRGDKKGGARALPAQCRRGLPLPPSQIPLGHSSPSPPQAHALSRDARASGPGAGRARSQPHPPAHVDPGVSAALKSAAGRCVRCACGGAAGWNSPGRTLRRGACRLSGVRAPACAPWQAAVSGAVWQWVRAGWRRRADKGPGDQLFDTMDANDLNKRLKELMDGLSVKVRAG